MSLPVPPDHLPFTGNPEADALIATDPLALLIGFALDQQVTVQKAFVGPLELRNRIGSLDAATIATMDHEALETAFRTPPALHRFPGNMAKRVRDLCTVIADEYGDDAARVWNGAATARGPAQAPHRAAGHRQDEGRHDLALLGNRYRMKSAGWDESARSIRPWATSNPRRRSPSTRPASAR